MSTVMMNDSPDETQLMRCSRCEAVLPPGTLKCAACGHDHRAGVLLAGEGMFAGDVVGAYELIEELGDGGFGVVWRAKQSTPLPREVALKLIKPGMHSSEVIARFESERERLAMMHHPNIATVYDAGTTPSGRPYFVMELVKGKHLTAYCDERKLSIRERLELFTAVCEGVQHAHHKGILHRDLKPSNIMVTEVDGQSVPKIIDFGVAKALEAQAAHPLLTHPDVVIGTRCYMSPEQAGSEKDVDARSDVYALGVVLYELLTGHLPLSVERLHEAAWQEARRIICEEDPPKPSSRAQTATQKIATSRQCEPRTLERVLKNDLDWVALMALEKDRERRYATPTELAQDVQRYLNNQPVIAAPPSRLYRCQKFARRHPAAVAIGALAAVALLLVTVSLMIWTGKRSAENRAKVLDGELDVKRAETAAGRNSLCFDKAIWEHEHGSLRREIAWLAEGLRSDPADSSSLDRMTFLMEAMGWAVPVAELDVSPILKAGATRPDETDVVKGEFSEDGASVIAWTLDVAGNPVRTFRAALPGGAWEPMPADPAKQLPPVTAEQLPPPTEDELRKLLRTESLLLRKPESWMKISLSSEPNTLLYSPGKRWAATVSSQVNNFYGGSRHIGQLFDCQSKKPLFKDADGGSVLDDVYLLYPLFDPKRDRLWLIEGVENPNPWVFLNIKVCDLKADGKLQPPVDLQAQWDVFRYFTPRYSRVVVETAMLNKACSTLAVCYTEALESRMTLKTWSVKAEPLSYTEDFNGTSGFPGKPLDVSNHQRLLVSDNARLLVCDLPGRHGFAKPEVRPNQPMSLKFLEDFPWKPGPVWSSQRRYALSTNQHGQYEIRDEQHGTTARFWLADDPGESGNHHDFFAFSEDEAWVIAMSTGPHASTHFFDCKTGRDLFPEFDMQVLQSLNADRKTGTFSLGGDYTLTLRRLQAPVPGWYLRFIEAMIGCRIENGGPVEIEPVLVSKAWATLVPAQMSPESKAYADHLRQLFGEGFARSSSRRAKSG